jgi:hypothetical protein
LNLFDELSVATPFLINALKHHLGFIRTFIDYHRRSAGKKSLFYSELLKIGNSVTDIYCGSLSIVEIVESVELQLKTSDSLSRNRFRKFIRESRKNFRNIEVRDGSVWTLLLAADQGRYLHLHPERSSAFIVRVKANALKTAIVIKTFYSDDCFHDYLLNTISEVRVKLLGQSPIKDLNKAKGISSVLNYLVIPVF